MHDREQSLAEIEDLQRRLRQAQNKFAKQVTDGRQAVLCLYGRQSKDANDQALSKPAQERTLNDYVDRRFGTDHGMKVVFMYDEDISGGTQLFERPEGRKVNLMLERGDHFITARCERTFRNNEDHAITCRLLEMRGVFMHFLDLNVDTTTPMGQAFLAVAVTFAQFDRKRIGERTKSGLDTIKAVTGVPTVPPLGWKRIGKKLQSTLAVCQLERDFATRVALMRDSGMPIDKIALTLDKEGRRHPRARKLRKIGGGTLTRHAINRLITAYRLGFPSVNIPEACDNLSAAECEAFKRTGVFTRFTEQGDVAVTGNGSVKKLLEDADKLLGRESA